MRRALQPLFVRVEPSLASAYRFLSQPPAPNLWGDRDVEHSWVAAHIPLGPGSGLDFGSGNTNLSLVAVRRGLHMLATDRIAAPWSFEHPDFMFVQGDAFALGLAPRSLDLIINCSTVEHLGLGRYGDPLDTDADLDGMQRLRDLLSPSGVMLLTIPVGVDTVMPKLHRIYGRQRLPRLLAGFSIAHCEFWVKNQANRWSLADEQAALSLPPTLHSYALGCFVLRSAPE